MKRVTLVLVILAGACSGDRKKIAADAAKAAADSTAKAARAATLVDAPRQGATISGFKSPESVRYDSADDVYYVSNVNGDEFAKDDNGFITRMKSDGTIDSLRFIAGGRGGVTLNAPHGSVIIGDTLWVADIDAMRAFNKRTGAPVATVDLKRLGAVFLNDVAAAPDGSIYVTDTGPDGVSTSTKGNRIFRVGPGHKPSVAVHSDTLRSPNGLTWDQRNQRFIIVQWGGGAIVAWRPGTKEVRTIGFGDRQSDGVELLADGRLVFDSWASKALIVHHGDEITIVHGFDSPADFAVDTRRHRLAIPLYDKDVVEFWDIPPIQP